MMQHPLDDAKDADLERDDLDDAQEEVTVCDAAGRNGDNRYVGWNSMCTWLALCPGSTNGWC